MNRKKIFGTFAVVLLASIALCSTIPAVADTDMRDSPASGCDVCVLVRKAMDAIKAKAIDRAEILIEDAIGLAVDNEPLTEALEEAQVALYNMDLQKAGMALRAALMLC